MVSLTIDGKRIRAHRGDTVLWAALDKAIYIPNLCALRETSEPAASCRLCFVEIEGEKAPVTACTTPVADGMVVNTQGPVAQRLARTAFELLMTRHPVDCGHCPINRSCELQRIATHLRTTLKVKRFKKLETELPVDSSSPLFIYDPNKCVLCGRCVWICREQLGIGAIGFAQRGFQRVVTTFAGEPIAESRCQDCGECVATCPASALVFKGTKAQGKPSVACGVTTGSARIQR